MAPRKQVSTTGRKGGAAKTGSEAGSLMPFESLRRNIDRMFDDFTHGWPWHGGRPLTDLASDRWLGGDGWPVAPSVDVSEDDKELTITAELPGLEEKDVELELRDDILTLSGEKKSETEEKKKDYYLSERRYGSFRRSFRLPDDVDASKIKANFKNGVLKVACPKTATARPRAKKINIASR